MNITAEAVVRIAALGRLGITAGESAEAARDLSNILDHFATIKNIATDHIPTYDNATGLTNVTREDNAFPDQLCATANLRAAAPDFVNQHFKVQAVFSQSGQA